MKKTLIFALLAIFHSMPTHAAEELEVLMIRPEAENVIDVQQISVTFNRTMVPLGDYEKLAQNFPIEITPKIPCSWRWLNGSTLACNLDKALPLSNSYKITVPAGIKSYDGVVLKAAKSATFSTQAWAVVNSSPIQWSAPDVPSLTLTFNQPMDLNSLQSKVTTNCGKPTVAKLPAKVAEDFNVDPSRSYSFTYSKPIGLDKQCELTLPKDTKAESGPLPSEAHTTKFSTYPEFRITSLSCYDKSEEKVRFVYNLKISGCDPDYGITLALSTPTTGTQLSGKIKTEPAFGWIAGSEGSPEDYQQQGDQEIDAVYLRSPLQGSAKHTVSLKGIKDRFGRDLKGPTEAEINTTDFSPMLQLPDGYGVMEKFGPHQHAVGGVNVKEIEVQSMQSTTATEMIMWDSYNYCKSDDPKVFLDFIYRSRLKTTKIPLDAKINSPFLEPLDIDKIAPDFKYGVFVGKMENAVDIRGNKFSAHRVCSNVFTVVTDLGITAKVGFYGGGVWIHSIKSGDPLKNIKVTLYGSDGPIFDGTTNEQGFVELPGAVKWDPERNKYTGWEKHKNLFIIAEAKKSSAHDDDFSVLPFEVGTRGLEPYNFNQESYDLYSDPIHASTNHIIHAITDRPLYKPAQKVNIKLFARHWEPRSFGLKPAREIEVEVFDALGKSLIKKNVKLSEFGTAFFDLDLESNASLGTYRITAKVDKFETSAGYFDVQEFTLPAFKVSVQTKTEKVFVGESANFATQAQYHFGGGVPNSVGNYTANFSASAWAPTSTKWSGFSFDNPIDLNIPGYEKSRASGLVQIAKGKLTTDKNGDATVGFAIPSSEIKSHGRVEYGVSFADDRGKSIAGFGSTEVFYTQFSLGMKTPQWVYEAKEEITPEVILLDREEKPVSGVEVQLKLIHRTFKTVRRHGEGSYFYYESRSKDQEIATCTFKSGNSPKGCGLKSKAAGSHYLLAIARDAKGRLTQSTLSKFVTGKEYIGWYRENHDRIDVIPEKKDYKVGETLKILVKNPYTEVNALVTLERFGILKQFRKKLTQGAETISIPLDSKDYAPGFVVSVHLIKGRVSEKIEGGVDLGKPSFKMGMTRVNVIDPDTLLKVATKSDQEQYQPGDKPKVSVTVDSPAGNDVTELSVAVVDEKILQLAGDYEGRYKLHEKFYHLPGVDVLTSQMLSHLIGRRHFGKKGAPMGGDGDASKSIRKNILPLAYWNPELKTDKNGKASFDFQLPDNLTTWRVLVVAVDQKHRFGFGSGTFRSAKKIMTEPALPSFLTEGDVLNSRFAVYNRSGSKADVKASLKVTGVEMANASEKMERENTIENDGKAYFEWKVKAPYGKTQATFEALASSSAGKDGILEKLPIYPFASYETFAQYGSSTEGSIKEPLRLPSGIRTDLGGMDVMLSSSLISHLDDSFRFLFSYPYTCWEQTITRAVALGQYASMQNYLSIPEVTRDPRGWAAELAAEMPKFQYDNGGMAYWKPDSRTVDPYLSVYTALALQWLKAYQVKIPEAPYENLLKYIRGYVSGTHSKNPFRSVRADATVLAMASFVLAEEKDNVTATVNKLHKERANLSLFGKSFLWMAASAKKENAVVATQLKSEIFSAADLTSGTIQFKELSDDGFAAILHSTVRSNCSLLATMMKTDPQGKFVEPLVRWVINGRKANHWNNTQENIFCHHALIQYAQVYEKDFPNFTVAGTAFDRPVKGAKFESFKAKPVSESMPFTPADVGKDSILKLERKGKGRVYYTARMRIAYQEPRTTAVNSGMQVARTYFVKDAAGKWIKQDKTIQLNRGQTVKIVLNVSIPALRTQVVLDDRLPAGLEPVNTALGGTAKGDAEDGEKNESAGDTYWSEDDDWYGFYSSGGFYHREMKLHSVQYFAQTLGAGKYEISYVAQAIATGEFNANPALIEQMYEPEVYGKSTPAQFIITEAP